MVQSIRFDCFKTSRTEVRINLEVNWLMTKAKQAKIKCFFELYSLNLNLIIIHSNNYFPNSDWLKAHA